MNKCTNCTSLEDQLRWAHKNEQQYKDALDRKHAKYVAWKTLAAQLAELIGEPDCWDEPRTHAVMAEYAELLGEK